MPRTTLDIDATVLRELKRRGRQEGKSLGRIVSELLAPALAAGEQTTEPATFAWHAQPMKPRIDLDDTEAVQAVLDRS